MIMWTAEELGLLGAEQYTRNHAAETGNMQFVMESDFGTFAPIGLEITGNEMVQCILQRIMRLVSLDNITIFLYFILVRFLSIYYYNIKINFSI